MAGKSYSWAVRINGEWCKRCGLCVAFCPRGVLKSDEDGRPVVIDATRCTGCLLCEMHCPDFAIVVKRGEQGDGANTQAVSG